MFKIVALSLYDHIPNILMLVSRAGGGGSDSDGDGGDLFALIGYGIGYGVSKPLKKFLPYKLAKNISLIIIICISAVFIFLAILGGSFVFGYILLLIISGLWIGWYQVMFDIWQRLNKKFKKTDQDIAKAAQTDAVWSEAKMHERAKKVFLMYQEDWTRLDSSRFSLYMTQAFANKTLLFYQILRDLNRQNAIMNPEIVKIDSYEITDNIDNESDNFTVVIEAKANDMLVNLKTNQTIFTDNKNFIEYWKFVRHGNDWLLDDINQNTANTNLKNQEIIDFAGANNMLYSLDMGWLFLPERGQVFEKGLFGKSDINNHAMGYINNILTQVYTYRSGDKNDVAYTIGQINIPKFYGHILVKPKTNFFSVTSIGDVKPPSGTVEYKYEWEDFNRKFEVWASDRDRLASFELINPKFMQTIYDIDDKIVIEVVDNIVYFRSSLITSKITYNQLMEVLKQAYKELKL
jgi:hypothetical protein